MRQPAPAAKAVERAHLSELLQDLTQRLQASNPWIQGFLTAHESMKRLESGGADVLEAVGAFEVVEAVKSVRSLKSLRSGRSLTSWKPLTLSRSLTPLRPSRSSLSMFNSN